MNEELSAIWGVVPACKWLSFQDNGHMPSLTLLAPDWQNISSTALSTSGPEGESLDLLILLLVGDNHQNSLRGTACFWGLRPACEQRWSELVGFHLLSGLPCVPTASAHKLARQVDLWEEKGPASWTRTQRLPHVTGCHRWEC